MDGRLLDAWACVRAAAGVTVEGSGGDGRLVRGIKGVNGRPIEGWAESLGIGSPGAGKWRHSGWSVGGSC